MIAREGTSAELASKRLARAKDALSESDLSDLIRPEAAANG